ncbi:hypothetical protein ACFXG4_19750 [Nocardia sp. NPDC059246]|uniref:hypothetical protein n=1 Tax=unclassified Nocardia TaxID=2637762 RepID=UPI003697C12E
MPAGATYVAFLLTALGLVLIGPVAAGFLIEASGGGATGPGAIAALIGMATFTALTLGAGSWMFWTVRRSPAPGSHSGT